MPCMDCAEMEKLYRDLNAFSDEQGEDYEKLTAECDQLRADLKKERTDYSNIRKLHRGALERVAELMAEVERMQSCIARMTQEHANERYADPIRQENRAALVRAGELTIALRRYGQHEAKCNRLQGSRLQDWPCDCGLDAALAVDA